MHFVLPQTVVSKFITAKQCLYDTTGLLNFKHKKNSFASISSARGRHLILVVREQRADWLQVADGRNDVLVFLEPLVEKRYVLPSMHQGISDERELVGVDIRRKRTVAVFLAEKRLQQTQQAQLSLGILFEPRANQSNVIVRCATTVKQEKTWCTFQHCFIIPSSKNYI